MPVLILSFGAMCGPEVQEPDLGGVRAAAAGMEMKRPPRLGPPLTRNAHLSLHTLT